MPTLSWIGKEKVINHHQEVPFRVLDHIYGYENGNKSNSETLSGNKIIYGDNLEALKALLPEYENRVNIIYIDPPYNTGIEGWVYNDNVNDPKLKNWLGQVVGKESEDLSRHDKWLCMMYPRIKLLHKLLAIDGIILISIDDNEHANLRLIMDEIFGSKNFIANFYWKRTSTPPSLSPIVRKKFEPLICFQKSTIKKKFSGGLTSGGDMPLLNASNAKRTILFKKGSLHFKISDGVYRAGEYNGVSLEKDIEIVNGFATEDVLLRANFKWREQTVNDEIARGTKFIIKSKNFSIRYQKEGDRVLTPSNIISKIECEVETNEEASKSINEIFGKNVFQYPKPISLIEYLINFLPNPNSIILDSFSGSGTTAHAVLNLNKLDGGNRKFILVEMEDYADTITAERIKKVIDGFGNKNGTGGSFDFYQLGLPIFNEDGYLNEKVEEDKIRNYVFYTETKLPLCHSECQDNDYFLNKYQDTAYYFYYRKSEVTTLNHDFLSTIKVKAELYIIYADHCLLTDEYMAQKHITFKKIPRDLTKF